LNEQTKLIPRYPLKTAVLFLVFNRFENTKKVFEAIQKAKPPRLYIAADGARQNMKNEQKKVQATRDYILNNINWKCEVKTLFRDRNLGCKYACSGAISWFFENEEMGIILEDDTLPSQSFFWFCEILLDKYKNDLRVWHIAGNNFHFGWKNDENYSYYFGGIYGSIWGWATWRNRWQYYDVEMKDYNETDQKEYLESRYDGSDLVKRKIKDFNLVKNGLDTWDFQWVYARWIKNGLTIVPIINLVTNIGFGDDGTHTRSKYDKRSNMKYFDIEFPLNHPDVVQRDIKSEKKFYEDFVKPPLFSKLSDLAKKILGI